MDKIEQLDRILIDYNLGNIKRHKAREKICLLFDVVGQSEQLSYVKENKLGMCYTCGDTDCCDDFCNG
jgi:hypothetical protein